MALTPRQAPDQRKRTGARKPRPLSVFPEPTPTGGAPSVDREEMPAERLTVARSRKKVRSTATPGFYEPVFRFRGLRILTAEACSDVLDLPANFGLIFFVAMPSSSHVRLQPASVAFAVYFVTMRIMSAEVGNPGMPKLSGPP